MDEKKIVLCRLCLDVIQHDDCIILDSVSKNILLVLVPELALDITDDPKICQTCNQDMVSFYEFKNRLNEKVLHSETKSKEGDDDNTEGKLCFFCNAVVDKKLKMGKEIVKQVLQPCFPNWKLFTGTSSPCIVCYEELKCYSGFANSCLDTERKVKKHCEIKGTNSQGKINLYEMLECILDSNIKQELDLPESSSSGPIKTEINENPILHIKIEPVDIKSEEPEDDLQGNDPLASPEEDSDLSNEPCTSGATLNISTQVKPTPAEGAAGSSDNKKRPATTPVEATTSKQPKVVKEKPKTRSIGIQVNVRDLIEHFSVGIQVNPMDWDTKSVAISAKPSVSDVEVTCKPSVSHATTATGGHISKEKSKPVRKRSRKLRK